MKLFLLNSLFFITTVVHAQQMDTGNSNQKTAPAKNITIENSKEDSVAITKTLTDYFKGIYEGDTVLLSSTFNPGTLLFGDVKDQSYAKTLQQYLDEVKKRQSPKDSGKSFKGEVISIDVMNSIAIAKVRVKMYDFNYHEFLSFDKINNKWVIVNKMITDVPE
jgi:hypothetical protein